MRDFNRRIKDCTTATFERAVPNDRERFQMQGARYGNNPRLADRTDEAALKWSLSHEVAAVICARELAPLRGLPASPTGDGLWEQERSVRSPHKFWFEVPRNKTCAQEGLRDLRLPADGRRSS